MPWEEVAVAVQDDGDGRVAGPGGDLLRAGSLSDPEGHGGVPEVVGPQRRQSGLSGRWRPVPGPPLTCPERAAVGAGEEERVGFGSDEPLEVDGQFLGDRARERYLTAPGPGLGPAGEELAPDLDELLGHVEPGAEHVDPAPAQTGQLADAEAAVATDEHEGAVTGRDDCRERCDLSRGEEAHLAMLDLRQRHVSTRGDGEEPGVDGRGHGLREDLVRLVDGVRR